MILAAWGGHHDVVRALAENGAEVGTFDHASTMNPLHYAARYNHLSAINVLIEMGAAIDAGYPSLLQSIHSV